jgi:hypothetical protein
MEASTRKKAVNNNKKCGVDRFVEKEEKRPADSDKLSRPRGLP